MRDSFGARPKDASADTFGTGRLRHGVLEAWRSSAARFREDANAEQDLALGGYRDRLVVELAQNASDAAARAGVAGRLRLCLGADGTLSAANTGQPLDAAGVESLATLRASAKRDEPDLGAVGRFGVGFSAVLAVTDAPAVVDRSGQGVRWSLTEAGELTRQAAADSPDLAAELDRREGHVPLLRLPLPAAYGQAVVPAGYDTAVLLPLRDEAAHDLVGRLLDAVDDALLLALPGLSEVVVVSEPEGPARTLTRHDEGAHVRIEDSATGSTRWRLAAAHGVADAELLADRPVEERTRPGWSLTWAVPVDGEGSPVKPGTAACVHAPTPTDEPLGFPALLLASFPLEPTRRHVAPGPLTRFLLGRAADAYAELLRGWHPVAPGTLDLVPGPLGLGELDGRLRALVLERLPEVPFLASAAVRGYGEQPAEPGERYALRPRDAEIIEGAGAATVAVLAEVFGNLLPAGLERRPELRALEVARVPLGEAVDRLTGVEREPGWWWRLYDSLAGVDPERLTGLPVPLADGRRAVGPRHVLLPLPDGAVTGGRLARLGLKAAHAEAVHPLLERLGATTATPHAVLTTPQVRAAVAASLEAEEAWDEDDGGLAPEELVETVLGLVRDAHLAPGDEPWLGALALPDEDGEPMPAAELVYPGSPFARVLREGELAACDAELAERWGEGPLTAVGVQAAFALVRAEDVVLDPDGFEPRESDYPEPDDPGLLDAVDVWCEDVLDQLAADGHTDDTDADAGYAVPPVAVELVAVRDLDLVDDACWPEALAMLARPPLRDALTAPVRVRLADGTVTGVRPYTAWWLRGHPVLDGRRPAGLRAARADPLLRGLYEEADPGEVTDDRVLRALGVRTTAAALLAEPGGAAELLTRLADPDLPSPAHAAHEGDPAQLHGLYTLLASAGLDPETVTLPDELRAVRGGETVVVDAAEALVADAPDVLPLLADRALLPVAPAHAAELAGLLEVRRASEAAAELVPREPGTEREVPAAVRELLPHAPSHYREHEELVLGGVDLDWRRTPDGTLHAATLEGLASALAWSCGAWPRRFELTALLEDQGRAVELSRARWFD
ncbi:molecular chaperone Hsp90 [Streptomyces diacarni]|uniref:Molecular chaperone Hsp90 n=1 Tax=Streptomyces diacarni TaxID=2800381 RepID=A0A367FCK7_9ACTN|nr:molecular chaperone Hsp90 [Streptomyces diacarni]RCG28113.1 molecular chaperone Hsp90 [Streptomyces diacarni]